jgi:hypothetical protein
MQHRARGRAARAIEQGGALVPRVFLGIRHRRASPGGLPAALHETTSSRPAPHGSARPASGLSWRLTARTRGEPAREKPGKSADNPGGERY